MNEQCSTLSSVGWTVKCVQFGKGGVNGERTVGMLCGRSGAEVGGRTPLSVVC